MKAAEIRDLNTEELQSQLDECQQGMYELEIRKGVADEPANPLKARALRRTVARIRTVMRERQREGEQRHG